MRRGLNLLRDRLLDVLRSLAAFAERWRAQPNPRYTHLQQAQLTTVGKRATLWTAGSGARHRGHRLSTSHLRFRGVKGTTGTQASFLELFEGDHEKVGASTRGDGEESFPPPCRLPGRLQSEILMQGSWRRRRHSGQRRQVQSDISACCRHSARSRSRSRASNRLFSDCLQAEPDARWSESASWPPHSRTPSRPTPTIDALVQYFERTLDDSANRR